MQVLIRDYWPELVKLGIFNTNDVREEFRINVCRSCIAGKHLQHLRNPSADVEILKLSLDWWNAT